jgi:transposase, IS6 family
MLALEKGRVIVACGIEWTYLYRAVDSTGASIDFLLAARRDAAAAKRFFQKALRSPNHPTPRVINVDKNPSYPPVVEELKSEGTLRWRCQLRPVQYLNNIVEQDHRAIKRRVRASQGFRSFWGAWRTIQGYEAMHAIRKGQVRRVGIGQVGRRLDFITGLFEIAR